MALSYLKLRTDRNQNKRGEYPVAIFVHIDGIPVKRGVKVSVKPQDWDEKKMQVRPFHPLASGFNRVIAEKRSRVDNYLLECEASGDQPTTEGIDDALAGKSRTSFFTIAEKHVAHVRQDCSWDHYLHVKGIVDNFKEYCGGDIRVGGINKEFLEKYIRHLKGNGNEQNTVIKKLNTLKTPFLAAFNKGLVKENPFHEIKLKSVQAENEVPSIEHVRALRDMRLSPGSREWHARNAWIFAYYMHGMRFTDICLFRKVWLYQGNYRMNKNQKLIYFDVHRVVREIADQYPGSNLYLFPFLPREYDRENRNPEIAEAEKKAFKQAKDSINVLCNRYIKLAGLKAGIPLMLTMHMARDAFAEHVTDLTGDARIGQKLLNHSSLNTTQRYFDSKNLDKQQEIARNLFEQLG